MHETFFVIFKHRASAQNCNFAWMEKNRVLEMSKRIFSIVKVPKKGWRKFCILWLFHPCISILKKFKYILRFFKAKCAAVLPDRLIRKKLIKMPKLKNGLCAILPISPIILARKFKYFHIFARKSLILWLSNAFSSLRSSRRERWRTFWYSPRNAVKNACCCGLKNSVWEQDNHFTLLSLTRQPHSSIFW